MARLDQTDGSSSVTVSSRSIIALAMACVALSVLLFSIRAVSIPVAIAGLAIIWLSVLPSFLYLKKNDFSAVPVFPMVGLFYLLFFGIAIFVFQFNEGARFPEAYDTPLVTKIRTEPLVLVAAGLTVKILVFVFSGRFFQRLLPNLKIVRPDETRVISVLAWILIVTHLIYKYLPVLEAVPSVAQFLEPAGYTGYAILLLFWARGNLTRGESIVLFAILLPLVLYARVQTIFLTQILLFGLAAVLILWKMRAFKSLAVVAALSLVVLTGYGATAGIRDPQASRFTNFYNVASAYLNAVILGKLEMTSLDGEPVQFKGRFGSLIQRTAHIWVFHRVYDWTPRDVPYWNGSTYLPLMTSIIPRVLYPDKPEERAGLEFGVTYELIAPNSVTSVNIPWITEMLMNFGVFGVVGGMAVVGLLLALVNRVFNSSGIGIVEFAIGLPILIKFIYPESNFSVSVGSAPLFLLCSGLYFYVGARVLRVPIGRFLNKESSTTAKGR